MPDRVTVILVLSAWAIAGLVLGFGLSTKIVGQFAESARHLGPTVSHEVRQSRTEDLSSRLKPARRLLTSSGLAMIAALIIWLTK